MAVIYLITNTINNKKYIGVTIDIKKRISTHKNKPNRLIYPDIKEYGWEIFNVKIVYNDTIEECYLKEQFYIEKYNCEYNIAKGGYGGMGVKGEDHWNSELTESKVLNIR